MYEGGYRCFYKQNRLWIKYKKTAHFVCTYIERAIQKGNAVWINADKSNQLHIPFQLGQHEESWKRKLIWCDPRNKLQNCHNLLIFARCSFWMPKKDKPWQGNYSKKFATLVSQVSQSNPLVLVKWLAHNFHSIMSMFEIS